MHNHGGRKSLPKIITRHKFNLGAAHCNIINLTIIKRNQGAEHRNIINHKLFDNMN